MDHTFVLRLLGSAYMDIDTLSSATFSNRRKTRRLLEELYNLGLVERRWDGRRFLYRARRQ
jgi:DNA-binding IclR family transcriptional regulator